MPEESVVMFLRAQIGEFTGKLHEAEAQMQGLSQKGGGHFNQLAGVGKAALLGIAGGAAAAGYAAIRLADTYEKSHAVLVTALRNSGTSWDAQKGAIDRVTASSAKLGFGMSDVEGALAIMTRGTGSSSKAISMLGVAQDLARAKGIDLATAATTVTRASEGQLRPLKQLGIDLPVAAGGALKTKVAYENLGKAQAAFRQVQDQIHAGVLTGAKAHDALQKALEKVGTAQGKFNDVSTTGGQILDALGHKLGGTAAAQAATFGGKLEGLKTQAENVGVKVGLWLIPQIEHLGSIVANVSQWLQAHKEVMYALAITIGTYLVAAIAAATVAWIADAAAMLVAIAPVLLIVAAIALLVGGVVLLWTHWNQVWNFIAAHKGYAIVLAVLFPIIPAVLAVVAVAKLLYANWDRIWKAMAPIVKGAMDVIRGIIQTVTALIHGDWGKAWDGIKLIFSGAWKAIEGIVRLEVTVIRAFLSAAWSAISGAVRSAWGNIVSFFAGLPGRILSALSSLGGLLVGWAGRAGSAALSAFSFAFGAVVGWFRRLPGQILGAVSGLIGSMYSFGQGIIQAIINGIRSAVGGLGGAIRGAVKGALAPLHSIPGVGGALSAIGLQAGGVARAYMPYIVGEKGPELFIPDVGGRIVPNSSLRSSSTVATRGDTYVFSPTIHVTTFDKSGVAERIVDVLHPYVIRNGGKLPWERARESRV